MRISLRAQYLHINVSLTVITFHKYKSYEFICYTIIILFSFAIKLFRNVNDCVFYTYMKLYFLLNFRIFFCYIFCRGFEF